MGKKAILLIGNVRTWDECKESFKREFGGEYDIFISTYDAKYNYHPWVRKQLNFQDHEEEILDKDIVKYMFEDIGNVRDIIIETNSEVDKNNSLDETRFDSKMKDILTCYSQARKLEQCVDSMIRYENINGFKYETVIKTRFDLLYNKVELNYIKDNEIVIDSNNVYPNDWLFATNRNNMVNISKFLTNEFYEPKYEDSNETPPHQLLLNSFKNINLNVIKKNLVEIKRK